MKIGMTTVTFRKKSIEEIIDISKKANIDGLEWAEGEKHVISCDEDRINRIKNLSKDNNIEIFSYGSYCKMLDKEQCRNAIQTAKLLGAPIIRVWAGQQGSSVCEREYYGLIVENTQYMADIAKDENIIIGFEYHPNTLTDSADEAINLIKTISRENVKLYWQTDCSIEFYENQSAFNKIKPYMYKNIHVNTYKKGIGYTNVSDFYNEMYKYFNTLKDKDYNLIVEFVKDGTEENLVKDVETLKNIMDTADKVEHLSR